MPVGSSFGFQVSWGYLFFDLLIFALWFSCHGISSSLAQSGETAINGGDVRTTSTSAKRTATDPEAEDDHFRDPGADEIEWVHTCHEWHCPTCFGSTYSRWSILGFYPERWTSADLEADRGTQWLLECHYAWASWRHGSLFQIVDNDAWRITLWNVLSSNGFHFQARFFFPLF